MRRSSICFYLSFLYVTAAFASSETDLMPDPKPSSSEVKVNSPDDTASEGVKKSVVEEKKALPSKSVLKVKAGAGGQCPNLKNYPYVYYGKAKEPEKVKEGESDEKSKYFVSVEFLEKQKKKYQFYYSKCGEIFSKISQVMQENEKGSRVVKFCSDLESELRAAIVGYKLKKISQSNPQSELEDTVKFKRILKYKYVEDIKNFEKELKTVGDKLKPAFETLSGKDDK